MSDRVSTMRREILSGSINRSVLRLAWPVAASNILQTLFGLIDGIWVGRLGPEALAGVSTGGFAVWAIFAVMGLVGVGVNALVAQAVGAGGDARAARIAGQGMLLALAVGVVISVAGLAGLDLLFRFMHTDAAVTAQGKAYLSTLLSGLPVLFAFANVNAVFGGAGDTQTTMRLSAGAILFALVLDPVLIYGLGPIPGFGVRGAALATIISRATFLAVGVGMLLRSTTGVGMSFERPLLVPRTWWSIMRIRRADQLRRCGAQRHLHLPDTHHDELRHAGSGGARRMPQAGGHQLSAGRGVLGGFGGVRRTESGSRSTGTRRARRLAGVAPGLRPQRRARADVRLDPAHTSAPRSRTTPR